jgi:hypothetical protein
LGDIQFFGCRNSKVFLLMVDHAVAV